MKGIATAATPTIGPAIVTVVGLDIPVLAFALSFASLLLVRQFAPEPTRKLTRKQDWALTAVLAILLLLIVSGRFGGGRIGEGMAVTWGIGFGFSGLLIIDIIGQRIVNALRALIGVGEKE